ncbi:MAG: hypothetical protein ACR2Q3_12485, partial [Woeseiaceae bacterium]
MVTMVLFSNKSRPYHLGTYPLERLARDPDIVAVELARKRVRRQTPKRSVDEGFNATLEKYRRIFHSLRDDQPAAATAPVPDDPQRRMIDLKGSAYFLNASQVGICKLSESCWLDGTVPLRHTHAVVVLVKHGRMPENGTLANAWVEDCITQAASLRAYEIAISIANHVQQMGFSAVAHDAVNGDLDLARLVVLAGLGVRSGERVLNPYLDGDYAVAAISIDYDLAIDQPLQANTLKNARGIAYWLGYGGCTSGLERWRRQRRPTHFSKFAMETVDRVDRPTTLIIDDEVPRVPKRASFFERPVHGDLGKKTQHERTRFAFKHPLAKAMTDQIGAMVAHQDGAVGESMSASCADAAENTRALKTLSYFLGAELTGVCEIPDYAWYSHDGNGEPVACHHRYAVVMLIDQEY